MVEEAWRYVQRLTGQSKFSGTISNFDPDAAGHFSYSCLFPMQAATSAVDY
jgi:hypothetical protein